MAGSFPTSVTVYTNPTGTTKVNVPVGGRTLSQFISDLCDDAEQVQTKLGTGASTPAANTVLRGTGTGSSAFGAVQTGDVTAGAITGSAFASETTNVDISNNTQYNDLMTLSYTSTGGDLLVWGLDSGLVLSGTPGDWSTTLRLDSGTDADLNERATSGAYGHLAAFRRFTGVSSGAHTLALRGFHPGVGTMRSVYRSILVLEIKK